MDQDTGIRLVLTAAQARNEPPVSPEFIALALARIDNGEEEVERYPTGGPTLQAIYDVAVRLHVLATSGH